MKRVLLGLLLMVSAQSAQALVQQQQPVLISAVSENKLTEVMGLLNKSKMHVNVIFFQQTPLDCALYNLGRFQAKVRTTEALLATLEKAYRLSPPLELDQDKQELGRIDNARQDYVIAKKLLSDCEEIAKCLRAHGGEQRASLVKEAKVQINNEETQVPFAPMILD